MRLRIHGVLLQNHQLLQTMMCCAIGACADIGNPLDLGVELDKVVDLLNPRCFCKGILCNFFVNRSLHNGGPRSRWPSRMCTILVLIQIRVISLCWLSFASMHEFIQNPKHYKIFFRFFFSSIEKNANSQMPNHEYVWVRWIFVSQNE